MIVLYHPVRYVPEIITKGCPKMRKRALTRFLAFALALVSVFLLCKPLTAPATAAEITPYFNNVVSADVQGYVSSAGVLTLDYYCAGRSGITEKIVIRTYIEKKVAGLFWSRVDIGGSNNEWVFVSNSSSYSTAKSFTLPSKGTYRVSVTFTVSGSGGDADTIQRTLEKTY